MSNKLEICLRKAGRELADWQIARFFKVPEEMTQTPCDFFGYTVYGRAILIEAKHVNRPRLPIGCSPGIQPHQWNELLSANKAGALALVVWGRGGLCRAFTMDMAIRLSVKSKSIAWDDLPAHLDREIRPTKCLEMLDHWLPLGT